MGRRCCTTCRTPACPQLPPASCTGNHRERNNREETQSAATQLTVWERVQRGPGQHTVTHCHSLAPNSLQSVMFPAQTPCDFRMHLHHTQLKTNWTFLKSNVLHGLAELVCKEMRHQTNPLAALAQKSSKEHSITKVKWLKTLPHLRGTTEITAQTSPITYTKSEQ